MLSEQHKDALISHEILNLILTQVDSEYDTAKDMIKSLRNLTQTIRNGDLV